MVCSVLCKGGRTLAADQQRRQNFLIFWGWGTSPTTNLLAIKPNTYQLPTHRAVFAVLGGFRPTTASIHTYSLWELWANVIRGEWRSSKLWWVCWDRTSMTRLFWRQNLVFSKYFRHFQIDLMNPYVFANPEFLHFRPLTEGYKKRTLSTLAPTYL